MTRLEEGEDGIRGCLRWHLAGTAMIPKEEDREKTRTGSVQGAWPLFISYKRWKILVNVASVGAIGCRLS